MKRTILIALILCTVFFITASSSLAQVINGCVKNNGQLSIVSDPGQCKNNETQISWNATGPQGPQGVPGVTAGISAAVWGEYILNPNPTPENPQPNCSVPFFRGAASIAGTPLNDGECRLTFTLPAGQQSWGNAFACFTSIVSGNATPWGTTCHEVSDVVAGNPAPIIQCLDATGQPVTGFTYVDFLCIN
jgi:hypothetical protein